MQGRYPRTIAEFGGHQREVWVQCSPCGQKRRVPLDVLEAMFEDALNHQLEMRAYWQLRDRGRVRWCWGRGEEARGRGGRAEKVDGRCWH